MDLSGAAIRNIKVLCTDMKSGQSTIQLPMRVNIPYYQRPYKWGKDNIEKLIGDFKDNKDNDYFIGSVVMVGVNDKPHDVIDGQQRITTMFLLEYLFFLLQRAYTEELIVTKDRLNIQSSLSKLTEAAYLVFGEKIGDTFDKLSSSIMSELNNDKTEEAFKTVLPMYQKGAFLPKKTTDSEKYEESYKKELCKLLKKRDTSLALKYKRKSYNEKMNTALAKCMMKMSYSDIPNFTRENDDDNLVNHYLDALEQLFNCICKVEGDKKLSPMDYAVKILEYMDSMLEKINFCVIITGNTKDAYILFEVLNDRAFEIEDLDLIKNLFYKWYDDKTNEKAKVVDECIEEVDRLWVEEIFTANTGKEITKMISYFAATYFTADGKLKYNDNEKYRELLEKEYLKKLEKYNSTSLKNDINIYQMISMILKKYKVAVQKRNDVCIEVSKNVSKSITYKTIHLLNTLKQFGVLAALINIIVKKYVDDNTSNGVISINGFNEYLEEIENDVSYNNQNLVKIHEIAFQLWKNSLLCPDATLPREEAKEIIKSNNTKSLDLGYKIDADTLDSMKDLFEKWMVEWRYSRSDNNIRAKVLFLYLYQLDKDNNKLKRRVTARAIQPGVELELDHMEASKINDAMKNKYFTPKDKEIRETYTDAIGNFMILDNKNNNNKNNSPLVFALKYYKEMCKDHWLIEEVENMKTDSDYFENYGNGPEDYKPKKEFFNERRSRLKKYFIAILTSNLKDNEMKID